jgi:cephalosporin-C deacetylase
MQMPDLFQHTTQRPSDFDAYWQQVLEELDGVPSAPEEEEIPLRCTEFCTTYGVRFSGIGPYRLFGYLSIPQGEGPFPALLYLRPYQSVVEVIPQGAANENRSRFVVFSLAARGQRNADRPYAAPIPGLFTEGIEDPQTYLFRGVTADCCRALDYLLTRPEVDRSRIAAVGATDMPLLTAALRPGLTHAVATPSFFYAALDRAAHTQGYPLEELNDYLRSFPERRAALAHTLSYFDPLFFAPSIHIPTLIWGAADLIAPLSAALPAEVEIRESEHSRYLDGGFEERWLARQLGFAEPILPAHWQD